MPSLSEETGGRVSMLMPGSTIGIIGGGQLGRMMALSARYMGFRVGVLDPTPNCPTGQVADFQITAEYDDKTAIHDLAVQSDVLTYEFENVDAGAIDEVRGITATPQGTDLLRVTQHRVREKQFINDHGTATAPWRAVNNFDELDAALGDIHYPAVLKTVSGGYDGHGQLVLRSDADLEKIRSRSDRGGGFPPSILEGFVDFAFEASILVSGNGKDFVTFPIVRNEHRNNILHMTIAPAEVSEHVAREAHELAIRLAKGFELAGTLAIELFITKDDQVIVNELAPRLRPLHHRGLLDGPVRRPHPRHRRLASAQAQAALAGRDGQRTWPACGTDARADRHPPGVECARLRQGRSAPRPQDGPHHRAHRRPGQDGR